MKRSKQPKISLIRIIGFVLIPLLVGCATFEPQERKKPPLDIPQTYELYREGDPGVGTWWHVFESPELNRFIAEALSQNFDIQSVYARLKQAQAVALQVGAQKLPSINYELEGGKSRIQTKVTENAPTMITEQETWRAGLAASYEIDLWGRVRAEQRAEIVQAEAVREDLDAAAVSVAGEVMITWLDIIAVRRKMVILREQIRTNETLLELQKLRFANGIAKGLEVSQQKQTLAAAKSEMPLLARSERQLIGQLALLLGRGTSQDLQVQQDTLPVLIELPSTGLPADLLASRPDVRAAGLRLRSADWEVSAARANRLPSLSLSASAVFSSGSVDLLFDNWVTSLTASLTGPLFDAGRRKAEVARTRAVAEERLTNYAKTVAQAIKEVEDYLVAERYQQDYLVLLTEELNAARLTLKDASLQYQNGQSDYLNYLLTWNTIQNLERQMVAEKATLIKNRVGLYRAVGGVWVRELIPENTPESLAGQEKTTS
jgi:NodT family efflux transporter outer membrane factor (OMF) lipoprotein